MWNTWWKKTHEYAPVGYVRCVCVYGVPRVYVACVFVLGTCVRASETTLCRDSDYSWVPWQTAHSLSFFTFVHASKNSQ
jgi:hypothetical protein